MEKVLIEILTKVCQNKKFQNWNGFDYFCEEYLRENKSSIPREFNNQVGIDANILTKLDADAKGGAALSISFETKKPILFVGIGQSYEHLKPFNRDVFISSILDIN